MKALPWILVILLAWAVLFLWNRQQEVSSPRPDTTEYVDTIPFYKPIPRDSVVIRYETIKLPLKKDSCEAKQDICTPDSAEVVIPIIQKVYDDSLYRAWVSGYNAKLDSIKVYARTREIRIPIPIPAKCKRWGLGLQAGYGYPNGWYVGVGVNYNLFQW
ncbi:hypothetical protein NE636_02465 [Bacteroides thetaiotaomicron]|uniref:DUF6808 domain-containing protein n=1 Tax=Bacteroides thetaiotaomicron TaxID=818 RepID=UPI001C38F166|nr:hypothetical protein [Bacteroides thetaiotaomicron]MBV4308801.1 hypothetical protein [Bacteroides thetaiotaomicron]MBV4330519.1 hypothetical protein [Bacteroides thetaiotaomicron]MCB7384469.1 hypothetical protein [Bacteroides thetaiotaomicron]MCG4884564.1 hypothetical protein [Bacteroides thetaiotaomicron]MCQ5247672.1 hypothetical protein [Bacteroides thetaiotaomicron]